MADLTDIQAAQSVKLIGSSTSGAESTPVRATANGDIGTADVLFSAVAQGSISLAPADPAFEVKVGGSPLTNRKLLYIQCQGGNMTFGFTSGSQPFTLPNGTTIPLSLGPGISIWLKKSGGIGSTTVVFAELA